ncbi:CYFA0S02e10792g1_1 [Cyberlindnera fabianii]|uniref:CYFA0S02e10792g1_1 n=1 Tax=Cyberlindnera fabianii TaxID=36022 RepID=A0A061APG1_CYBFA|nr:CYFA0S02e10792g1_1 [Cyberlindnera fabianii]
MSVSGIHKPSSMLDDIEPSVKKEAADVVPSSAATFSSNEPVSAADNVAPESSIKQEVPSELSSAVSTGSPAANGSDAAAVKTENGSSAPHSQVPSATKPTLPQPDIKIIRRKLTGYVGFANLPKQWHRKSIRRGFNLNLLVVGEAGLGKSTLINTLFNKELYEPKAPREPSDERASTVTIKTTETDIEENGVKLHLTVVDTPGFGEQINNTDAWQPIVDEINSRFDSYLEFENKINRATYVDSRIHACLYFIEPTGHSLKPLDIEFLQHVHKKVNIIPVIAKSDTLTEEEILEFKQRIKDDIKSQGIEIFEPKIYDDDDEETIEASNEILSKLPFAIVGSTKEVQTPDGRLVRARQYPWGIIEVDNEDHNDFVKLRQLLVRNFLEELREKTANVLYETYRSEKLLKLGIVQDENVFREFDPSIKQQEEKALHEAKLAKLEAEMKQIFQQKVSEKEKKLQKSEAELFSRHKEVKEKLLKQVKQLEEKKKQLENARLNPTLVEPAPAPSSKTRKGFLR